ncbi:MAG: SGNH/GDSL hydrolase family protein [Fibrobacteria bacterium]|nr:SGNH/GDSL hydrolase family protein [Fibrobacteria bacterium]
MTHSLRFFSLATAVFLATPVRSLAAVGDGTPQDTNLVFVGRWDTSSPSAPHSYWGGAYIRTGFTGNSLSVKLGKSVDLAITIDGRPPVIKRGANGTVSLASGLASGDHTIKLVARFQNDEIIFQGFVLASGGKTFAPPKSKALIEFVGNSITSGSKTTNGNISAYAWLTGEALGVDRTAISFPGITLTKDYHYTFGGAPTLGQEAQYFKTGTPPLYNVNSTINSKDWDFRRYTPDLVVINLGANDRLVPVPSATFRASYVNFLKNLRSKLPQAHVFVMRPYGGHFGTEAESVVKELSSAGDSRLHFINTSGWLVNSDYDADGLHPSDAGQIKATEKLVQVLRPYIDAIPVTATPRQPSPHSNRLRLTPNLSLTFSAAGRNMPRGTPITLPSQEGTTP